MELIAFVSYMSSEATIGAQRPIFLAISSFSSIPLSLMTWKNSSIVHIHRVALLD